MGNFVQIGLKWVNLAKVMWVEDSNLEYKLFFEKSTILVVPKTASQNLVAYFEASEPTVLGKKVVKK